MILFSETRQLDPDELAFKKRALRDAVICIGWIKLVGISTVCYIILYFLVHANSKGKWSMAIQIMLLVAVPLLIANGVMLFLGALQEKLWALEVSLGLCLLVSSYNTVLGVFGGIFFIRFGNYTVQFLLACTFGLMAISLCTVICHDIVIIVSYKRCLQTL
ncbi:unnamed protein product [Leptidea sinapis]|uniref:Uncharacterized protein n=1 Tax=Leptidea sinapis TaxID=189913 RepID=A0A5E4QGF0_9NEOP|nr:unnamed protein product [Leptidea sinapis]